MVVITSPKSFRHVHGAGNLVSNGVVPDLGSVLLVGTFGLSVAHAIVIFNAG